MNQIQGITTSVTPMPTTPGVLERLRNLFTGGAKEKTVYDLQIVFHRAAAGMLVHGQLVVTSREFNLVNRPVNFSFVGVQHAPLMTPDVIYHIWTSAVDQGFVPHSVLSYKATV